MAIPRDRGLDSTLALLKEGYAFIPERCCVYGSDLFATRLMGTRVVCVTGAEAAGHFYAPDRFTRRGAIPQISFALIQDKGSVTTLDGAAHRRRKAMFLSLVAPPALQRLAGLTADHFRARARRWASTEEIKLFHEAHVPLTAAVCEWVGLPLDEAEAEERAREFEAMVEGTGSVGPRNWRGHLLRARTERWMRDVVRQIRAGERDAPEGGAARTVAEHRDGDGELLDLRTAAVELINVLRPTVANARLVGFAAYALHEQPECREALRSAEEAETERFVHEVRRFYPFIPFIPFIGGKVLAPFEWRGHCFAPGDWALMDIYGTNRDPRHWDAPERFSPERFRRWDGDPFTFIPQGGGDHRDGHRCPGEWITIEQMKAIVPILANEMRYEVPPQDLTISLNRLPALPRSRFVMKGVRI